MSKTSFIFDMDGTLWDAVDSYAAVWNATIKALGLNVQPVTRQSLAPLMGIPLDGIYDRLVGSAVDDKDEFLRQLRSDEDRLMPKLGGKLYPGVADTLRKLKSRGNLLFMVSNCGPDGIPNFLNFTGLSDVMTDWRSIGCNGLPKDENMLQLVSRYNLEKTIYVGDTPGDCALTHRAGLPFVWAAYGFGQNPGVQEYTIHSFTELLNY